MCFVADLDVNSPDGGFVRRAVIRTPSGYGFE